MSISLLPKISSVAKNWKKKWSCMLIKKALINHCQVEKFCFGKTLGLWLQLNLALKDTIALKHLNFENSSLQFKSLVHFS